MQDVLPAEYPYRSECNDSSFELLKDLGNVQHNLLKMKSHSQFNFVEEYCALRNHSEVQTTDENFKLMHNAEEYKFEDSYNPTAKHCGASYKKDKHSLQLHNGYSSDPCFSSQWKDTLSKTDVMASYSLSSSSSHDHRKQRLHCNAKKRSNLADSNTNENTLHVLNCSINDQHSKELSCVDAEMDNCRHKITNANMYSNNDTQDIISHSSLSDPDTSEVIEIGSSQIIRRKKDTRLKHIMAWKKRFSLENNYERYRRLLTDADLQYKRIETKPLSSYNNKELSQSRLNEKQRMMEETAMRKICELRLEELKNQSIALARTRKSRMKLTPCEKEKAIGYLYNSAWSGTIIDKFNIEVTQAAISCLTPLSWCNDEVINFYMQLLIERNERHIENGDIVPKTYLWSTFFYTKLMGEDAQGHQSYNYNNVRRWTQRKKVDIFSYDLLLIPVHLHKIHWALGVVNMRDKKIHFLDSMGGSYGQQFATCILQYLKDEHQDKKHSVLQEENYWIYDQNKTFPVVPQQSNSSDCGVFVCQFCECLSDGRQLDFDHSDMDDRRLKMVVQICTGEVK